MGFSDPGCYGGDIETPNLDRLAAGGLRFTQMYSTARCWPSRTCILTGYYAQQVHMDPPQGRIPAWTRVLPHYLEPLGYRTYHTGKWHLLGASAGSRRRLRAFLLLWTTTIVSSRRRTPGSTTSGCRRCPRGPISTSPTAIADYGIGFLQEHARQHAGEPFLLYLAFTSPHFPLHALQADIDRYRDRYRKAGTRCGSERWQRMRELGIVDCELSAARPEDHPALEPCRGGTPEADRPGRGRPRRGLERSVRRTAGVPGDKDGDPRGHGPPHGPQDRPRARSTPRDGGPSRTR